MNQQSNWDFVQTPIGPVEMPGFDRVRAMSDEQLCQDLNTCAHLDPAAFTEARRRATIAHYHDGSSYTWGPRQEAEEKGYRIITRAQF